MFHLTLDTETSGLPIKQGNEYADPKESIYYDSSRLLQLSWICTVSGAIGNMIKLKRNYIVKIDIDIKNSHIHGIDNKIIEEKGINIEEIFNILEEDLKNTKLIIGYNIIFDLNIILAELYRFGNKYIDLIDLLNKVERFDVMIYSCLFLKLNKYIKLIKLYELLFKENFENPHNALNDVIATFKCFVKLVFGDQKINEENKD